MTTPINNNNNNNNSSSQSPAINPSAAFPSPIDSPLQQPNILELLPSRLSCEQFVDAMRWLSWIARRHHGFTHQVMFAGLAARVFQESDPQRPVEAKLGAGEGLSDLAMGGVGMLWDQEDTIRVAAGKQDFDGIGERWYVDDGDEWDEEDCWKIAEYCLEDDDDEWDYDGDEDDEEFGGDEGDGEEDCWDDEYCLEEENYLDEDEDDEDGEEYDEDEDESSQCDDEDDDGRGRRL